MIDKIQMICMILMPLMVIALGFLYLFLAAANENYVNREGQKYFCELHPGEPAPHDSSFWYLKKIEADKRAKQEKKQCQP